MYRKFYSLSVFFISLLLSIGIGNAVNAQTVELVRENWTNGGDGTTITSGEIMIYRITATNTISSNITSSIIYGHIPAGTSYVEGSTRVNDVPVSDVNGKMPFAGSGGGLINSPSAGPGIVSPNTAAIIEYKVTLMANMGSFNNYATLQGTTSAGAFLLNTETLSTNVITDIACNEIFQSTATIPSGAPTNYPYKNIQRLNTSNGTAGTTTFTGASGPCYNIVNGTPVSATPGSVLTDAEAMAYDRMNHRIFFINNTTNNPAQELCYLNLAASPIAAYKFVGYPLETNTGTGYNINRMTFAADGYGYALTANAQDLIRFSIDPSTSLPVISPLGALINDVNNGANDVLAEVGGDMFGDASGKLFLIPNSGKLYRIDPATRVAVYLGTISGMPTGGANAVAVITNYEYVGGIPQEVPYVYIGGAYQNVYKVDLSTMIATAIASSASNVYKTGDYTSCALPIYESVVKATKKYTDLNGGFVLSGDPIEYTIEVTNTGNINAGGVKLFDAIPAGSHYTANSTTVNGVAVADIGGSMPFAASGGQFIYSSGASAGIIKPGDANKVVIKFMITTDPRIYICNQATVSFPDGNGSTMFVITEDPAQAGLQDATCFYSDGALGGDRLAVNSTPVNAQQAIESIQVRPNPFVTNLDLQIQLNTAETVQVRLFDLHGRTVFTTFQKSGAGVQSLHLNIPSGLSKGIYVLEVKAGTNQVLQKKLLKQ